MSGLFGDYLNPAMKDVVAQKEQNIRQLLDEVAPGWTLDDIKHRCVLIKLAHDPLQRETLCLDGKPVMEFYPLETAQENSGESVVFRVTQKYRRLP